MIRTGIFGGSFNPIHNGHIALADEICRLHLVDELWLMVSPQNPFKQNRNLLPEELRLRLARIAIRGHKHLHISDFECRLPRPSYMVVTLQRLGETYPDRSFALIIGADNWINFSRWYCYKEILQKYPIIVYPREGFDIDKNSLPSSVTLLNTPLYHVSSTDIRRRLRQGLPVPEYLNPDVEHILRNLTEKDCRSF